ncbi:MAG: hypothetical protein LBS98_06860 [Coriobacteriales bacterium]|nr:hypothetical protein [Coriobacteriales bacterium]
MSVIEVTAKSIGDSIEVLGFDRFVLPSLSISQSFLQNARGAGFEVASKLHNPR